MMILQNELKKVPENILIGAILGLLVAIGCVYAVMGCAVALPPAQDARVGAYGVELDQCTTDAKAIDAGNSAKIAWDNACQCSVAARYGWEDSGVLGCSPTSGISDGGVK